MATNSDRFYIGEALDRAFRENNSITLWASAIIIGLVVIWSSTLIRLDTIYAQPIDAYPAPTGGAVVFAQCWVSGKRIDLWNSLNWSVVYLGLFPAFLILNSTLATATRTAIDDFVDSGLLKRVDGKPLNKEDVRAQLDQELRSTQAMYWLLIAGVAIVSAGGWWTSAGSALFHFKLDGQVIDWSTAIIPCGDKGRQFSALIYTALAYLWMGFALFAYLSCLFLGYIYCSFLNKLASTGGVAELSQYRMYFDRPILKRHFSAILRSYFVACVLGLMAGYFMRLQSDYLFSPNLNILEYLGTLIHEGRHGCAASRHLRRRWSNINPQARATNPRRPALR